MAPKDHTVPQMYLRRFAERRGKESYACVHDTASLRLGVATLCGPDYKGTAFDSNVRNIGAISNFYTFRDELGASSRAAETMLGRIETRATRAFNALLDGSEYALPTQWPLSDTLRKAMAWWIAAQLLRTTRQRQRVNFVNSLVTPRSVDRLAAADVHVRYLVEQMAGLAYVIWSRPWGMAFTDACLLTSDCPVLILNGQDHDDQTVAASLRDVLVPLDSHRLLLLPGYEARAADPAKRTDHLIKFEGMLGAFAVNCVLDAADRHLFFHPSHRPLRFADLHHSPPLPKPWAGDTHDSPEVYLSYGVLPWGATVERRWLSEHPPDRNVLGMP